MRLLKNKLGSEIAKVASYRRILTELLDNDEDMAYMNLSHLAENPFLYLSGNGGNDFVKNHHQEIEELLESYLSDFNSLETKMNLLVKSMQSAEELMSLRLDTSRNQLLFAETILSVVAICFAMGSFIGSILGMNLMNGQEYSNHAFAAVTAVTILAMLVMGIGIVLWFQRCQILPKTLWNIHTPIGIT
jgi:Mg2+ and Co2+ transporter CorA